MFPSAGRAVAIAGIGQTSYARRDERSEARLAAEAALAALADAGIAPADVDGMITYTLDPVDEIGMCRALGVRDLAYTSRVPGGGAGALATVYQAACAVASGACEAVLIWRAINQGAAYRYGQPQAGGAWQPGGGTSSLLWCMPFGAQAPATWAALAIQRYMHEYGVTNRDFGRVAVLQRKHAASNPAAIFHGKPITLDEHQASRWIVEPVLRLLDCCQENAGAAAAVITTLERARDARQPPVRIAAAAQSIPSEVEVISNYYHADLSVMPEAVGTARRLWAQSGLSPADVRVALLYDAFTPNVMKQLEAFGFCAHGEAKDFVADGHCELTGRIPTNTHGGHGGEAYIHGMNFVTEGVRQIRGSAANQVVGVQHALVSSGMAGAILARA
ncbi:MAG TPA: lipid-transfer protein [Myxococcota bacterium]|jgi:acetyl-CoA acetyltransferase